MHSIAQMQDVALAHHRRGELPQATAIYRRILRLDSGHADTLHLLGVAAHQQADHETAIRHIQDALRIDDTPAAYHSNLGTAYRESGEIDKAVECFRRAIQLDPATAGYPYNLANALKDLGQFTEAVDRYQTAIELDPEFAEAHNNLGDALKSLGRIDEALHCHHRAIEIRPTLTEAWFNLGNAQRRAERFDAAATSYRQAVKHNPAYVAAWVNLGYTCEDLGEVAEAIASYDAALRAQPDCADAHFNRALALLQLGDFENGWSEYEWRWQRSAKDRPRPRGTEWDGSPLLGKTVHVYHEQGIGDELMFASCLSDLLAQQPAAVTAECDPRLSPLLQRSFPSIRFVARLEADPATDVQIALGSLPGFFRNAFVDFPETRGYLRADDGQIAEWRLRYGELGGGITIGISWRGGRDETVRRRRSTTLDQWRPLFDLPGVQFVNLQYGDCRADIDNARRDCDVEIHDWTEADPLCDLDGFAAKVAALDLVISVDNSTVHMAGGLGVPVWTLLPRSADWRWLVERRDTPWYPPMTLFRQPEFGDWSAVFRRVAEELAEGITQRRFDRNRQETKAEVPVAPAAAVAESQSAGSLNNLAIELQSQGRLDEALAHLLKARELAPRQSHIPFNLGNLYRRRNQPDLAVQSYDASLAIDATSIEAQVNRGVALREAGDLAAAEIGFDTVLLLSPELPEARFNRALVRLQRGDFSNGWPEYEWRWRSGEAADADAQLLREPVPLAGRKLLVRAEQGIGDEIMFASCLPDAVDEAQSCIVECDRRLVPLFVRSFPTATVLPKTIDVERPIQPLGASAPLAWDVCLPCGSLPMIYRSNESSFPGRDAYLVPDAACVDTWKQRFAELGEGLTVGISWSGGKDDQTRQRRSAPLREWRDVFEVDGVRFINLQYGQDPSALQRLGRELGVAIHHWRDSDPLTNLDDFAAQIAALDLVISVDNSTVHLAGALGTNVWTLLPRAADWRWVQGHDGSPWYPTMRLFRQSEFGDWSDVLQRVAARLAAVGS